MRKKFISVLMCSLLIVGCIGCGGASSSSGSSSSSSSSIVSSDTASLQNKEEKQTEYKDVMKDYDNFNCVNYPCTPVRVYGTVESIQSDKESESYFVKLDGKMFTVEKFSGGLDKVKVGDKVDWRGITSNDNGLVKICLENEVAAKQEETKKEEVKEETKEVEAYREGMYKVGVDIPAGEYRIFSKNNCYVECSKDSTSALESIIFNENLYYENMYVTLKDGEYFTMTSGIMYKLKYAPKLDDDEIEDGMYKVGVDIEPGEYKVVLTKSNGYYEVSTDSRHQTESIVTNGNITTDVYITIQDGQYITLKNCKLQK